MLGFAPRARGYRGGVDPYLMRVLRVLESVVYGIVLVLASRLPEGDEPDHDLLATPL